MNINRAGKQQKAYWRGEERWRKEWESEEQLTEADKQYGVHQITQQRLRGYATGWLDGVAWAKRNQRK